MLLSPQLAQIWLLLFSLALAWLDSHSAIGLEPSPPACSRTPVANAHTSLITSTIHSSSLEKSYPLLVECSPWQPPDTNSFFSQRTCTFILFEIDNGGSLRSDEAFRCMCTRCRSQFAAKLEKLQLQLQSRSSVLLELEQIQLFEIDDRELEKSGSIHARSHNENRKPQLQSSGSANSNSAVAAAAAAVSFLGLASRKSRASRRSCSCNLAHTCQLKDLATARRLLMNA